MEVTSYLGKYCVRYYYVTSYQENTVSCVTLFQIARNTGTLRVLWVMRIYCKDMWEVRSQDSVS